MVGIQSTRSWKSSFRLLGSLEGKANLSVFAFIGKTLHCISPLLGELERFPFSDTLTKAYPGLGERDTRQSAQLEKMEAGTALKVLVVEVSKDVNISPKLMLL